MIEHPFNKHFMLNSNPSSEKKNKQTSEYEGRDLVAHIPYSSQPAPAQAQIPDEP
jgi:hypothetical protein